MQDDVMSWYKHDNEAMLEQASERLNFPKYPEDRQVWLEVAERCRSEIRCYPFNFDGDAIILREPVVYKA